MDKELLFSYISGHATDAQIKEVMQWTKYNLSGSSEPLSARFVVEPGDFDIMIGTDSRKVGCARLTLQ